MRAVWCLFPAGKPAKAAAKNRASKSPNYHLEQLIALRDEYRRKTEPEFSTMRSSFCAHGYRIDQIGAGPATARPALT